MPSNPLVFMLSIAKKKPHSYRKPKQSCPFCDVENLTNIYQKKDDLIWLENKYPTLENTMQTVLIESSDHNGDIATYSKEHNRKMIKFALKCFNKMNNSGKYRSVLWYKNFGPNSGGSLIHPHMQIVGLDKEDGYQYITPKNFEGISIFKNQDVEVNVCQNPVQGFCELDMNSLTNNDLDLWADWIQSGVRYFLNVMYDGRLNSYNLFFYPRPDGGICAKLITRFPAPPYFVGYKLSQVNDYEALQFEADRFLKFYQNGSKI